MEALKAALASSAHRHDSGAVENLLALLPGVCLDVHICSVGGVGSTFLSNFLVKHGLSTNLLTDQDGLRHSPSPPPTSTASSIRRGVYLFGNPVESIASHFRRGHAYHQATKTSGCERLPEDAFSSLDEYLQGGHDYFGYHSHIANWCYSMPVPYDTMCIRYERMFEPENARTLLAFVFQDKPGVDLDGLVDEFCSARETRNSQVTSAQKAMMYVELQAEMDTEIADCFIRQASQ